VQTNLREIDAIDFDLDVYVNFIKETGANIVLNNVGGIVANYYTDLEFHYQNPNLNFDMIQEVTGRLHQEGIRVMGRFYFSKLNEDLAVQKPEWLYKSVSGEAVNYNGQVHTCVNGGYQQEYSFAILKEALTKFPLDGVFFNMIGYQTRDYGNTYHGICQSDACRERFKSWSDGLNLPVNVKSAVGSWKDKQVSNAAVHFYGYPARHSADARWLTQQRLFQNIMYGAGPDFYCIGRLDNLEDRTVLQNVKEVFQFHKRNEKYLQQTVSGNKVLLMNDGQSHREYQGIFEMLTENHVFFDVMEHWCINSDDVPRKLESYEVIILPDVSSLNDAQC
jgi:hypothetical protein